MVELFKRKGKYDFKGKESKSEELANLDSPTSNLISKDKKIEQEEIEIEKPIPDASLSVTEDITEVEEPTEIAPVPIIEVAEEVPEDITPESLSVPEKIVEILPSSQKMPTSRMSALEQIEEDEEEDEEDLIVEDIGNEDDLIVEDIDDHQFTDDLALYEMFQNQINSDHEEEEEEEEVIVRPKKVKKKKEIPEEDKNLIIHVVKSEEVNQEPIGKDGIEKGLAAEIEDPDENDQFPPVPPEYRNAILSKADEKRMTKYKTYFERGILDEEEYEEKQLEVYSKYEKNEIPILSGEGDLMIGGEDEEVGIGGNDDEDEDELTIPSLPEEYKDIILNSEDDEKLKKYQSYFQKEILDDEEYLEKVNEIYSKY